MQFLIDHLISVVIGSVIMLLVLSVGVRMAGTGMDAQIYETSRRHSQAFAQQLELDLLNAGYGVGADTAPIQEWTDSTFVFLRKLDTLAASSVVEIAYRRATVDSVDVGDERAALYEVRRFQDGVRSGGSAPSLTGYRLRLVDRLGQATTTPADAIGIAVEYRSAWGGDAADHVGSSARFSRTYYPPNLD